MAAVLYHNTLQCIVTEGLGCWGHDTINCIVT